MKKILSFLLPAAFVLALAAPASAADLKGRIQSVDTENQEFTMRGGMTFDYTDEVSEADLIAGNKVKVWYKSKKGHLITKRVRVLSRVDTDTAAAE